LPVTTSEPGQPGSAPGLTFISSQRLSSAIQKDPTTLRGCFRPPFLCANLCEISAFGSELSRRGAEALRGVFHSEFQVVVRPSARNLRSTSEGSPEQPLPKKSLRLSVSARVLFLAPHPPGNSEEPRFACGSAALCRSVGLTIGRDRRAFSIRRGNWLELHPVEITKAARLIDAVL
jgi:hypothetical protein